MNKKYYSLETEGNKAALYIYGDVTSWPWVDSDVSAYLLSKKLEELEKIDEIDVYINSYGGEVAEGLAIYNALKRHKAKVTTYCDGFACSIASVIFMAGDKRIMYNASMLMVHNAWSCASGNADEFRRQAETLDAITKASINAYMDSVTITEEELKEMLDSEKWLTPQEALDYGFATLISGADKSERPSQSIRKKFINEMIRKKDDETENEEETKDKDEDEVESEEETEDEELEETEDKDESEEDETKKEDKKEAAERGMRSFFNAFK